MYILLSWVWQTLHWRPQWKSHQLIWTSHHRHSSRFHIQVHAPIFTAFPSSLTVARGAAASFEATLNAPPATVAWMKDGKEVKEQAMKHRITASGNKVYCFFKQFQHAFHCTFKLICTVDACEKMMTTWNLTYHQWSITLLVTDRTCCLLDKHLYNSHSHHNTDPDNAQVCLDVMECTTGDAGQYALIITNKKGESKAAFSLNVWPQKISSVDLFWGKKASFLNPRDGGDPPKGARSLKNWDFIPARAAPGSPLLFILTCYLCKLTFIIPLQLRQHKSLIS